MATKQEQPKKVETKKEKTVVKTENTKTPKKAKKIDDEIVPENVSTK